MSKEGKMNKKGQVTMFVIIAIVIVVGGILVYQFAPGIKGYLSKTTNPNTFMQDCLENDLINSTETISLNGGSISPENSYKFEDSSVSYLCYTNEYNKYCANQVPDLNLHIEKELSKNLQSKINSCFNDLNDDFTKRGYEVRIKRGKDEIKIMPNDAEIISNTQVSLAKGDSIINTEKIRVVYNNNIYQLLGIARSIVEFESNVGDVETMDYMLLYRGIKVEKLKQTDGTKIYILTNKKTGDKFQFASRSLVLSPGFIDPITLK